MKNRDIYFWRYKDPAASHAPYGNYHCKSCKAIVRNGELYDTFWNSGTDGRLNLNVVDITFKGSPSEMKELQVAEIDFYRSEDIVDMRHSNNTSAKVYARTGASRNMEAMQVYLQRKFDDANLMINRMNQRKENLRKELKHVSDGRLEEVYPYYYD